MNIRPLVVACGFLVLLSATSVFAQSRDPYFTTFSANYDVVYHEENTTSNLGAHFDLASTFKRDVPYIGPVGEVGFNHFEGATIVSAMGGARVRIPSGDGRFLPYAQGVIGLYHCGACDVNDFAIQGGAGVDFRVSNNHSFRVRAQLDVRHVFDSFEDFNGVRLSGGIVLPLNK